eukprot:scaffold479774_cov55-Attheya_sp.AAC.2
MKGKSPSSAAFFNARFCTKGHNEEERDRSQLHISHLKSNCIFKFFLLELIRKTIQNVSRDSSKLFMSPVTHNIALYIAMESGMDNTPAPPLVMSQQQQCTSRCAGVEGRTRWDSIPSHLRIQVLHVDPDIIVISKPCNLRSVPGHAKPPPTSAKRKRPSNDEDEDEDDDDDDDDVRDKPRKTAQEAWVDAIRTFRSPSSSSSGNENDDDETEETRLLLTNLANTHHVSGVPRKPKLFIRYCERNMHRLLPCLKQPLISIETIAQAALGRIKERHVELLNLPEPTPDEDSAYGQLKLLGYETHDEEMEMKGDKISTKGMIYVVHRLDCETSGVMVFARNETSASRLCQAWRERDQVKKLYLAKVVGEWPPFETDGVKHGTIELPLAPSSTERLKWQVVTTGGKPSITHWRLLLENGSSMEQRQKESTTSRSPSVTLELEPVTGRTHQLRIAVSVVGSGILGDSLYGDAPIHYDPTNLNSNRPTLHLHAYKLSFPHPKTGQRMDFIASPIPWDTN